MNGIFKIITELNTKELSIYNENSEVQLYRINEPKPGIFIAESPKVITRALDAGYEPISLLVQDSETEGEAAPLISRLTDEYPEVPLYCAGDDLLTKITGFHLTRGVLCAMKRKYLPDFSAFKNARRLAVLENVTNPTNVGAIVRNAAALGMDGIIFSRGCTDPLYRRAIRVSMGTIFQIPWTFAETDDVPALLRENGFKSVAMALRDNSYSIGDYAITSCEKLAIFLGAEGDGLRQKTIDACDFCVCIPMHHGVDSLNVAAASALAFWTLDMKS